MKLWSCSVGAAALTLFLWVGAAAADVALPAPLTGGIGIFDALKHRVSAGGSDFPTGEISLEELSSLLWAATGINRTGMRKGWTVPMAMGREPYCRVYVTGAKGTFFYDWNEHALREISQDDIRGKVGSQGFVGKAPYVLIFVTDGRALEEFDASRGPAWGQVAVGAMTQNVYLAAESLNIGVRYIASLKADAVRPGLKLADNDTPVCIMPIGKK
ncbi:MAG: nitroreductase family protein [Synergistaceae bacterium]|jgi:nitroreductase|nr:nitroreductase family protein [Synergistaceae bacterium]